MCDSNIKNGKLDFTGNTTACHCGDGNSYQNTTNCVTCKGRGKNLKNGRNYRCKGCEGRGYTMLETPILTGKCPRCKGTSRLAANRCDRVTEIDREIIFSLFNFEKPYTAPTSSLNENLFGFGVVAGVTDYGRYLTMTPDQYKEEVRQNFMTGFMQYVSVADKDGNLPTEILISKKRSGWFAYSVFN